MARPKRIRIMQRDKQEFERLLRNTKAKIRRTQKNYGIDLSSEVYIPESIDEFTQRDQFNKWKQQMSSFTNRSNRRFQFVKNVHGVVARKSELDEIKRYQKQAQENAKQKRQELFKKMGEQYKQQRGMLKRPDLQGFSMPKDFDFDDVKHQWRLDEIRDKYEKRADPDFYDKRLETMKDNFIRSVEGTLGAIGADGEDIIKKLKEMPPDDFYDLYLRDEARRFMDFELWDSEGQMIPSVEEVRNNLSAMGTLIERYEEGRLNNDLKNF